MAFPLTAFPLPPPRVSLVATVNGTTRTIQIVIDPEWNVQQIKELLLPQLGIYPEWQVDQISLVARDAAGHDLDDRLRFSSPEFKRAVAVGLLVQRRLNRADLQRRLTNIAQADQGVLSSLLAHLRLIGPRELLDLDSLTAEEAIVPANCLEFPVSIIDNDSRQLFKPDWIPSAQGVMHVIRMLPDGGGVELRGKHVFTYRAASAEYAAEVKHTTETRAASIAHCKKLLVDLPVALKNSEAELAVRRRAADVELTELGAMLLEQNRISDEIAARTIQLKELTVWQRPLPDLTRFVVHTIQTEAQLRFGFNSLGNKNYLLVARCPHVKHEAVIVFGDSVACVQRANHSRLP